MSRQKSLLCRSCADRIDQRNGGRYYITELPDPPRFGSCALCHGTFSALSAWEYESMDAAEARRQREKNQSRNGVRERDRRARYRDRWRDW